MVGADRRRLRLLTGSPVLDCQLREREILSIPRSKPRARSTGGRCNQAIGLGERLPSSCEVASPFACLPAFPFNERNDEQTREKPAYSVMLGRSQSAHNLFDVDRAYVRQIAGGTQRLEPADCAGSAAQKIDEHRRVEQDCCHQPTRAASARRCSRTHSAGSASQSCPSSEIEPRADWTSSQRRSSSSAWPTAAAMNELRRRAPTRRSSSRTSSSRSVMCKRMATD